MLVTTDIKPCFVVFTNVFVILERANTGMSNKDCMYNIWCVHVLHVGEVETVFPIQFDYNSQALDSNAFGCVLDQILFLLIYKRNSLSAKAVN